VLTLKTALTERSLCNEPNDKCVQYLWQGALHGASYYSKLVPALIGNLRISDVLNINESSTEQVKTTDGLTNFVENENTELVNSVVKPSIPLPYEVKEDVQQLLQRPVEVYSFSWDVGGTGFSIDPLALWLANPAVARKLSNFMLLRTGGLKVKIVTNGTPYLYGRFQVGWWPHIASDAFATAVALASPQRISTLPHVADIDPSVNQSIEMELEDFMRTDIALVSVAPSFGSLVGISTVALQSATASGVAQYCEISIYVSAKDPSLQHNTFNKTYYATSAEYKGKISAPLTKVVKATSILSKIPIIGPYMTAAGVAAQMGADVAAIFGFSKPVTGKDPELMVIRSNGNMANTEGLDTASSLTFHKQAVSVVDPGYYGLLREDQLAVAYIIRRWSLCATTVSWADTDAVGAILATMRVGTHFGYTGTYPCAQTNLGYIAEMFAAFKGSLEVKAVFCVSQFHTGRIQILYDPTNVTSYATDPTNVNLNWVVDLQSEREVMMHIPFADNTPWKQTDSLTAFAGHAEGGNPRLNFRVVNKLRAGAVATTVTILLYVRAGEDFEFADPTLLSTQNASKQATFMPAAATGAAPTNAGYSYYGTSGVVGNNDSEVMAITHFTERVVSLRQLLKRYQFEKTVSMNISSVVGDSLQYICVRDYPTQPGTVANGSGTTTIQLNTVPHSAMTWLGPSFVAWRGSIKSKIFPVLSTVNGYFVNRASSGIGNYMNGAQALTSALTRKWLGNNVAGTEYFQCSVPASFGSAASCVGAGSPIEVSNHWTLRERWERVADYNTSYKTGSGLVVLAYAAADVLDPDFAVYKAVGDDFMFLCYKGPPIIYEYTFA